MPILVFCATVNQMFTVSLAFRNIISRKSSLVIILFIAFAVALLTVSNAIFDGTGNGIRNTFTNSFTGDIVVRPKADFPLSLFGDETPATGMLSEIPRLIPFEHICSAVTETDGVDSVVPQMTGQAVLNCNGSRIPLILFGVDGTRYLRMMNGITLLQGHPWSSTDKGLMLSTSMVNSVLEQSGIRLQCGDRVQLLSGSGNSFTMRSVPVSAIYRYPAKSDVLGRIALISPEILRELSGMSAVANAPVKIDYAQQNLLNNTITDIDDLFDSMGTTGEGETYLPDVVTDGLNTSPKETALLEPNTGSWNFLVCRVVPGISVNRVIRALNRTFRENEWPVQAVNWRPAAGVSAQYLYWMRLIFNIGIIVILGTGFIVVNNTLVISALDRTQETGTMRAIGAGRRFVAAQFLLETGLLTVCAGILGCLLGSGLTAVLSRAHITFQNMYLIQLFGGSVLRTAVTTENILRCMGLSVLLAFVGWLYPARIALCVSPVEAMQGIH